MSGGIYASIESFLDDKHTDFSTVCELLDYKFMVGKMGLTLLIPEESFIKDLEDLVKEKSATIKKYQEDADYLKSEFNVPEDEMGHTLARWFIQALVLTWYYPTAESFKSSGFIVNKLKHLYELKGSSKDKVELSIGTLTPNDEFKQMTHKDPYGQRDQIAVWNLKGKPKLNTPVFKQEERKKQGGAARDKANIPGAIALHIWYKVYEAKKHKRDMDVVYLVSLLKYIKRSSPEVYSKLGSVISWNPLVSLYLILQPGHSEALIDNSILTSWVSDTFYNIEPNAVNEYKTICDEFANKDMELNLDIKTHTNSMGDKSAFAVKQAYDKLVPKYFSIYKRSEHKINHDVLRLHYESITTISDDDYKRMCERMYQVDSKLGQHSLNPSAIRVDQEDLKSFIKSSHFLFHIRVDQDPGVLNLFTSPTFNISQAKLQDLADKLGPK